MSVFGIDLSSRESPVDYNMLAAANVQFGIVRISTNGKEIDPQFAQHRAGLTRVGIPWGVYIDVMPSFLSTAYADESATLTLQRLSGSAPPFGVWLRIHSPYVEELAGPVHMCVTQFAQKLTQANIPVGTYATLKQYTDIYTDPLYDTCMKWVYERGTSTPPRLPNNREYAIWNYGLGSLNEGKPIGRYNFNASLAYRNISSAVPSGLSTSGDTSYSYEVTGERFTFSVDQIHDVDTPYVITINAKSPDLDWKALKKLGVMGVMVHGGALYNTVHMEQYPRNINIDKQIKSLKKVDVPWALYYDCRARDFQEVQDELYQIYFLVNKYPPFLGMWLHIQLSQPVSVNDKLVDAYYQGLVNLGLKDRIGFYVTPAELKKITWEKHMKNWYLWTVDHVSSTAEFTDNILSPEFYVLPE